MIVAQSGLNYSPCAGLKTHSTTESAVGCEKSGRMNRATELKLAAS
jgi:hypothetical protein